MSNVLHARHAGLHLALRTYGHGPVHVLAFHGFGRTGTDFQFLGPSLAERCTVHAFDLPFHGHSPKPRERTRQPYGKAEFAAFFREYLDAQGIDKAVFLGYSLGGRIALCLLESLPERALKGVLLAPDGLVRHPWYRALAGFGLGRWLYRGFVRSPDLAIGLTRGLERLGGINERMARFLLQHMQEKHLRQLVHDVWVAFRLLEPDLGRVAEQARGGVPLHLVFGRHDRVIRTEQGRKFQQLAPQAITVDEVEAGHVLLTPAVARYLVERDLL